MNNECKADLLNLSQAWVHCVLYFANVYPKQSFQMRTMYGIDIPVSKSKSVKQYITKIFEKVRGCIEHINYIQIEIATFSKQGGNSRKNSQKREHPQNLYEKTSFQAQSTRYRFYFDTFTEQSPLQENRTQKQIQLKRFMHEIKQHLLGIANSKLYIQNEQSTWKFRMQYRFEAPNQSSSLLIDPWIPKSPSKINQSVIDSLKFPNLQIIATKQTN